MNQQLSPTSYSAFEKKITNVEAIKSTDKGRALLLLLLLCFCSVLKAQINLDSGLVAYYPFNGNANDESGNENNGVVNGATLTYDRFGIPNKAYSFDGGDDIIKVDHNAMLCPSNITISAWVKINKMQNFARIVDKYRFIDKSGYNLVLDQNTLRLAFDSWDLLNNQHFITANSQCQVGIWYNITSCYDGNILKLYVNGKLENSDSCTTPVKQNSRYLSIGDGFDDTNNFPFNGIIDDVRIYNRALNEDEILELYHENTTTVKNIEANSLNNLVKVYPNPTESGKQFSVTIENNDSNLESGSLTVYSISGQILFKRTGLESEMKLGGFSRGCYLIEIYLSNGKINKRVIVG